MPQHRSSQLLIVEIDDNSFSTLHKIFTGEKWTISRATNVNEVYEILGNNFFDLILISLKFPVEKCIELLKWIKIERPPALVITISEKKGMEAFAECTELGADDYITRPFGDKKTIAIVNDALDRKQKELRAYRKTKNIKREKVIAGYDIKGTLGKGSMGIVYLAEKKEAENREQYALKVLHPIHENLSESLNRELLERFYREAETASELKHENIVQIIDFGLAEEELLPYIVMEFVQGRSLRHYMSCASILSLRKKVLVIVKVAKALEAIHDCNIYHRDVKPENILLDSDLNVKVTDFGIARLPNSQLTQTIKLMGTPAYMAPEAYASSKVDHRADIFSLGVVAYELFLEQKPFFGRTIGEFRDQILSVQPVAPRKINPDFPIEIQEVIGRCLKKDPYQRLKSAKELACKLEDTLENISEMEETKLIDISTLEPEVVDMDKTIMVDECEFYEDWR